jgi:alpha-galactosidase
MTDEMLVAQAKWLSQYQAAVPQARQRLEEAEQRGTRVQLRETQGAARLKTKTVEEMARHKEESRANAAAADKGKMTAVGT